MKMDPMLVDPDGQPWNLMFNRARREERSIDELLGLCKGILADGRLVQAEAEFLADWLRTNWERADAWPVNVLQPRLEAMLADGVLDQEEKAELLEMLRKLIGQSNTAADESFENYSTALPLDDPLPPVVFPERRFVFTGKFACGSRKKCIQVTEAQGGECANAVSGRVHYLVIGLVGSRDWIHTSYGRKIEKAVALREKGREIAIIPEEHWAKYALDL